MDTWAILIMRKTTPAVSFLAHFAKYVLASAAWCVTCLKKKQLSELLHKLHKQSMTLHKRKINVLVVVVCFIPLLLAVVTTTLNIDDDTEFFTYGYKIDYKELYLIVFIKNFIYSLIFPTLTNAIALLFGLLCVQVSTVIRRLTEDVTLCSPINFITSKQLEKIKEKSEIDDILGAIQDIFSMSSLFIIISNVSTCTSILNLYLHSNSISVVTSIEWAVYAINSLGCLVSVLWIAGGVTVADQKFKESFHRKSKLRMFLDVIPTEPRLERWLFDKPDFVFNGWGILPYRRVTVFAVIGALVTYTVLIVN
ncbi:uncharacterized protein TNCV_1628061 [Trichonephila clavipes]|nr:uncharacterized protein TNCV_1628061 [Trichonephila clavipes]